MSSFRLIGFGLHFSQHRSPLVVRHPALLTRGHAMARFLAMDTRPTRRTTSGPDPVTAGPELSERDLSILDFERQWWQYAGSKDTAIRERFDMSTVRYYQRLNWLIDQPQAMAHDALLVRRLKRTRLARQRHRSARRLG